MKNLWQKKDYPKSNGLKVFSLFACGGGSTMGYKLAGFDVLGGVEIDKRMADIYVKNHSPKYFYNEDIRLFNKRNDLPKELYHLDILDGSPPCTSFSMAGNREKDWGKSKKFKEGQAKQRLDDLVFEFCKTVDKLRPKVAVMENVPGIIAGRAKGYALDVIYKLQCAGYEVQVFQLNSATMGVPQSRSRVFFIARRKDLNLPKIAFKFNCKPIPFGSIADKGSATHKPLIPSVAKRLPFVKEGEKTLKYADARYRGLNTVNAFFQTYLVDKDAIAPTLTTSGYHIYWNERRNFNDKEYIKMSTFPSDFDFCGKNVRYVCGMSVPPLMIARIAERIPEVWFS